MILIWSRRRPRKTNRCPTKGSSFSTFSACAAKDAYPLRMSVRPATFLFAGTGILSMRHQPRNRFRISSAADPKAMTVGQFHFDQARYIGRGLQPHGFCDDFNRQKGGFVLGMLVRCRLQVLIQLKIWLAFRSYRSAT